MRTGARRGAVCVDGLTVDFKVEQGPTQPWNFTLGASAFYKMHWQANAEVGFHEDVLILIGGIQYRF